VKLYELNANKCRDYEQNTFVESLLQELFVESFLEKLFVESILQVCDLLNL
jgi:hypothetical protein